jgi:chromosome segregation ATPase
MRKAWRWVGTLAVLACTRVALADDVKVERSANGDVHITIRGAPHEGERAGPGASQTESESHADAARDQASVRFSLKRTELEKQMTSAAADLQRTREAIRETEQQRFEAYSTGGRYTRDAAQLAVAIVAESANKFEQNKRVRLEELRTKERETLRRLSKLHDDAAEIHEDVTNFYGGQLPPWWRDPSCGSCPSPSDVTAALR